MTVEAIKDAIAQLFEQERKQLADWFEELAWDRQMGQDFAAGGRGAHLLEKFDRQIDAGNFTSLEERTEPVTGPSPTGVVNNEFTLRAHSLSNLD